jgi:hypothetical protein
MFGVVNVGEVCKTVEPVPVILAETKLLLASVETGLETVKPDN